MQFLSDALDDTSQRPWPSFSFFHLLFILTLRLASITALKFEATYKKGKSKRGQRVAAIIEGKIMNLSVETKVAIAVATSFILLVVGAMAQG